MDAQKLSSLLDDVEISGTVKFRGSLTFDGRLRKGDIAGDDLVIGPKGVIEGNIKAASLVLHGSVTGDVVVAGRCELRSTGNLTGKLVANRLTMQDGATLIGEVVIAREGLK